MIADGDFVGAWPAGQERRSKLVFIGRNLNRPQLRRGFEACQVSASSDAPANAPTSAPISAPANA